MQHMSEVPHLINAQQVRYSDVHTIGMSLHPVGSEQTSKNVYLHMPFITIIGVIKVDHVQARSNCTLVGCFYGLLLP